jgi:hypothetical protein
VKDDHVRMTNAVMGDRAPACATGILRWVLFLIGRSGRMGCGQLNSWSCIGAARAYLYQTGLRNTHKQWRRDLSPLGGGGAACCRVVSCVLCEYHYVYNYK